MLICLLQVEIQCISFEHLITIWLGSHHPAKSVGHRHCGSSDITFLVCYVILQENWIKGASDFMDRHPSR